MTLIHRQVIFSLIVLICTTSIEVLGRTTKNNNSSQVESRSYGGTAKFQDAGWKVWDAPQDQIAIEAERKPEILTNGLRAAKQQSNRGRNSTGQTSYNFPQEKIAHNGESNGMKRQGCNANLQVSILPIVLSILAVVAGIVGVFLLWIIAKSFFSVGNAVGGSSGGHFGTGNAQNVGSGWSQQRQDLFGFARSLKNVDFDQLTQLVSQAVETYRSIFETKPKKS